MQFTLKGTPFIYQGEEMGLINYDFESIEQINDVESRNLYVELCKKMPEDKAFEIIKAGTREHARIPLPFEENLENADCFTETTKNLMKQQKLCDEIFETYKTLISLRKKDKSLVYSDFEVLSRKKDRFVYRRGNYIVNCNLSPKTCFAYKVKAPYTIIYDSYQTDVKSPVKKFQKLKPYQSMIIKCTPHNS